MHPSIQKHRGPPSLTKYLVRYIFKLKRVTTFNKIFDGEYTTYIKHQLRWEPADKQLDTHNHGILTIKCRILLGGAVQRAGESKVFLAD